ncbi:hypothetical protein [Bacillus sp. 1NLA3E]|uniref:hypothetical protein n=1 Tax=Bacillus sp. 1NLA3E TaxID=666686 RepID=UPI000247F2EE|nr:hypothetical protein [Bacillus sp. 1NLA3E]AGK54068.1 hypothetical protein B1NLA3E_11590 [Bacillus sp. 1NLA3E]
MSFKDEFIPKVHEVFKKELTISRTLDETFIMIRNYFLDLEYSLRDVLEVAEKNFEIETEDYFCKVRLFNYRLEVKFTNKKIEIENIRSGYGHEFYFNENTYSFMGPDDKVFDESVLDSFLRETFESSISDLLR